MVLHETGMDRNQLIFVSGPDMNKGKLKAHQIKVRQIELYIDDQLQNLLDIKHAVANTKCIWFGTIF